MNCLAVASILDLFAEELLTAPRRAAVEAHLSGCSACRAAAAGLRAPKAAPVAAPTALKDRLRKALASAPAQPYEPAVAPWGGDGSQAALALAVFAIVLAFLHLATPKIVSERPVTAQAEPWRLP
jgi:anti-sigma factor RsiW